MYCGGHDAGGGMYVLTMLYVVLCSFVCMDWISRVLSLCVSCLVCCVVLVKGMFLCMNVISPPPCAVCLSCLNVV